MHGAWIGLTSQTEHTISLVAQTEYVSQSAKLDRYSSSPRRQTEHVDSVCGVKLITALGLSRQTDADSV